MIQRDTEGAATAEKSGKSGTASQGYPIILGGDHAEFESEWAASGKPANENSEPARMSFTPYLPGTSARFEACMSFIIQEEGTTFSDTPGDHGGATRYGIIQSEYNSFRHTNGLALQSVNLISHDEYTTIYWQSYWQPNCPKLPAGLDLSVFNINVNGGPNRGTRLLQQSLGIPTDGVWGGQTDAAVAAITDLPHVILAFHDYEHNFYQAIINYDRSQAKFASDWFGRNDRCEKLSLAMVVLPPGSGEVSV